MNTSSSVGRRIATSSTPDAGVVERADGVDDRARARLDRDAHHVAVDARRVGGHRAQRVDREARVGVASRWTSSRSPPTRSLSSSERALGDHLAVVDHRDRGRRAGRPRRGTAWSAARSCPRPRAPRSSPTARAGCADRGRWSARRGTAPAGGRPAPRRGRAAGACRRSRSWPGGRRRRRARTARAARWARSRATRAAEVVEAADHLEVLEAGQVLVDGRVLAGQADAGAQRSRLLDGVESGDAGGRRRRLSRVVEDAHRGRLAGAVRAEQSEHASPPGRRGRRRRARAPCRSTSRCRAPRSRALGASSGR